MRKLVIVAATIALAACSKTAAPPANDAPASVDANSVDANMTNAAAPGAALATLNETTWEFKQGGKDMQESIDAAGKYITVSGKEHIDHGTAIMKAGKGCFTSAMDKQGEVCWSDPMIAVGGSGESISDKGEKLALKRVAYVPLTM